MQLMLFQQPKPRTSRKKPAKRSPATHWREDLLEKLREDAWFLAKTFRLPLREITCERGNVRNRYGICYSDGRIKIRLNDLRSGKALRYSSLVNTLCHELAHLKHMNHGPRFQEFYRIILEYARLQKIYQPQRPSQQEKFSFPTLDSANGCW